MEPVSGFDAQSGINISCLTEYYFENVYTYAISNSQDIERMALFMYPLSQF